MKETNVIAQLQDSMEAPLKNHLIWQELTRVVEAQFHEYGICFQENGSTSDMKASQTQHN